MWVAGVDGCRGGWVAVLVNKTARSPEPPQIRFCKDFSEVLRLSPRPSAIAIDIPIGLLGTHRIGGRPCDQEARRLLRRRASSVFSPPSRDLLGATSYWQVRRRGLSCQAFHILPKIREVDQLMTPRRQGRVFEAHPELAFRSLAGHPMRFNKKTPQGRRERVNALKSGRLNMLSQLGGSWKPGPRSHVSPDDIVDACGLACTALQIAETKAVRVPETPDLDGRGLRMEIWF